VKRCICDKTAWRNPFVLPVPLQSWESSKVTQKRKMFMSYKFQGSNIMVQGGSVSVSSYTQVLGFLQQSSSSNSGVPGCGCMSYIQLAVKGSDMRMDSMRPPVFSPKVVPLSYTKLNSTYLPRRNCRGKIMISTDPIQSVQPGHNKDIKPF
jgi:hypothetical protein